MTATQKRLEELKARIHRNRNSYDKGQLLQLLHERKDRLEAQLRKEQGNAG